MSVDIYCNGNFYNLKNVQCYKDEIVFKTNIECDKEKNKIILLILNPRTNIDSLLYCSEFFFNTDIQSDTFGQMESKILVGYNIKYRTNDTFFCKIYFLTKGTTIIKVTIEMPEQNRTFMRELIYKKKEMKKDECYICYETKSNIINLHNNHQFCLDCILQVKTKKCPICRVDID
jgi:hypothetical protein